MHIEVPRLRGSYLRGIALKNRKTPLNHLAPHLLTKYRFATWHSPRTDVVIAWLYIFQIVIVRTKGTYREQ